jgi:hypothetical protein
LRMGNEDLEQDVGLIPSSAWVPGLVPGLV